MNSEFAFVLHQLVHSRSVAALGTLHGGKPFVSMVPFAVADGALVIHISRLASHTRDVLKNPEVSLLVAESETPERMPHMLARVTLQGRARLLERDARKYAAARSAYAERFPDASSLFEFSDFKLFLVRPLSARVVAGFGQAVTISGEEFKAAIST
ncbi:MAG TPA: pyridoxamine 5'-phosphate oxidase family protein [Acidobacteriota bacterium]|nr:pyridoxamine 5'-phosphate oxidase family protein [Acidobacteriota bacterium]